MRGLKVVRARQRGDHLQSYLLVSILTCLTLFTFSSSGQVGPQGLTVQGRILKSDDTPVNASSVTFTLQVMSPSPENCVLYRESHTLNMSGTGGAFALTLGSGNRSGTAFEDTSDLQQVFSNSPGTFNALNCAPTYSGYIPSSGDKRGLLLSFDDGSGSHQLTQSLEIDSVPYAFYADSLQGKSASDFLQRNPATAVSQTNLEAVFVNNSAVNELLALISGSSTQYSKPNGANFTPTTNLNFNSTRITNLANPTSAQDAATKNYCDATIGGKSVDSPGFAALAGGDSGKVLAWDGTKWVAQTASDSTRVAKTGDTMTGSLTVSNANVIVSGTGRLGIRTSSPAVGVDASGATDALRLPAGSTAQRPATPVAGDLRWNTTSPVLEVFNGTGWTALGVSGLTSLNGLNNTTQTFAIGTSGTVPAFNSSGTTHTLDIPLASAAGVTRGTISKSEFDTFNGKLGTATTFAGDVSGAYNSLSVDKIKGKTVSAAPTLTGQVLRYDGTNITPNFIAMTDLRSNVTGMQALAASCGAGQTLTYNSVSDNLTCTDIAIAKTQVSGLGTAAGLNAGTGANNLVQLDGSSKLPAIDGSALTNLNAGAISTGTLPITHGGTGQTSASTALNALLPSQGTHSGKVLQTDGTNVSWVTPASGFSDGGNTFTADATLGTNSNHALNFETNNSPKMTILANGNVGIGATNPGAKLEVAGQARSVSPTGNAQDNAAASVDWNNGNAQSMSVSCTNTSMTNMLDGGTYILAVTETGTTQCTFTHAGLTFYYSPANGAREDGQRTVYTFLRVGSAVYVSWIKGFQQ